MREIIIRIQIDDALRVELTNPSAQSTVPETTAYDNLGAMDAIRDIAFTYRVKYLTLPAIAFFLENAGGSFSKQMTFGEFRRAWGDAADYNQWSRWVTYLKSSTGKISKIILHAEGRIRT